MGRPEQKGHLRFVPHIDRARAPRRTMRTKREDDQSPGEPAARCRKSRAPAAPRPRPGLRNPGAGVGDSSTDWYGATGSRGCWSSLQPCSGRCAARPGRTPPRCSPRCGRKTSSGWAARSPAWGWRFQRHPLLPVGRPPPHRGTGGPGTQVTRKERLEGGCRAAPPGQSGQTCGSRAGRPSAPSRWGPRLGPGWNAAPGS